MTDQPITLDPTPEPEPQPAASAPPPASFQITDAEMFVDDEAETSNAAPPPTTDATSLAMLRIAQSMEKMMARDDRSRQLTITEILPVTPWNPEGKRDRLTFTRPTFMHGIALNPLTHRESEIKLFNALKPGRYLDRKVEVQRGNDGSINLKWEGGKIDKRIEMYSLYPDITTLLTAVIADRLTKEQKKKAGDVYEADDYAV